MGWGPRDWRGLDSTRTKWEREGSDIPWRTSIEVTVEDLVVRYILGYPV